MFSKSNTISLFIFLLFSFLLFSCDGGSNTPEGEEDGNNDNNESEAGELSAYITEVFEYAYAPGQHAKNVTKSNAENFIGKPSTDVFLGGFGGYVVAGFDHNVMNEEGQYDFEVFSAGISPEPAVVYVMCDENSDGIPNDTWYELKGNLTDNEAIRNYSVTYQKPESEDMNIVWTDNQGNSGELVENYSTGKSTYHWWWAETGKDTVTFTGTRLPNAYINQPMEDVPQNWVVPDGLFQWGYAENNSGTDYDKTSKSNKFDIANAIDKGGNTVNLPHIRFIKIQSAIFQQAGWLNEVSSEVKGAKDLHY